MDELTKLIQEEKNLLHALLNEHISKDELSKYYTILTCLRFRLFEGTLTHWLRIYDPESNYDDLTKKINGLKSKKIHLSKGVSELLKRFPKLRNEIAHGNFRVKISIDIWDELKGFLDAVEYFLESALEGIDERSLVYSEMRAKSLEIKIDKLFESI